MALAAAPTPVAATRPEVSVGAIVIDGGQLLLVRRGRPPGQGQWSVPGGRVEAGERLCDAVVREVAEETGLEVTCGALVGVVERLGGGWHFVILDYRATVTGPREPVAGDDAAEVQWVPLHRLAEFPLVEGLLEFLDDHEVLSDA
jgi:ADP-ribose pyrophosphatase YjhB (NUDIX family)